MRSTEEEKGENDFQKRKQSCRLGNAISGGNEKYMSEEWTGRLLFTPSVPVLKESL